MTPNRVVAILTPLLFAPLAGTISALLAEHFPGVDLPASSVQDVFIAGALIAFGKAAQWMHGWQKYEAREAARQDAALLIDGSAAPVLTPEELLGDEAAFELDGAVEPVGRG